jgi:2-haloacid dehalogenase
MKIGGRRTMAAWSGEIDSTSGAVEAEQRRIAESLDSPQALERLRSAGFRLVTLTNSAPAAVDAQLTNAGLSDLFERSFSMDTVNDSSRHPEPYQHVARELRSPPRSSG